MSETTANGRGALVLGAATVGTGLLAGLYYSYACSVMPGLHGTTDGAFVDAMQRINAAIENPVFFASFVGGPALTAWAAVGARRRGDGRAARWIGAALALHAVGLATTVAFNVPLNDALDQAGSPGGLPAHELHRVRTDFEAPWVAWNVVRTVATTAALGCLAWAGARRRR